MKKLNQIGWVKDNKGFECLRNNKNGSFYGFANMKQAENKMNKLNLHEIAYITITYPFRIIKFEEE